MHRPLRWIAFCLAAWLGTSAAATELDLRRDVTPFLGVDWWNNIFLGVTVPYGVVKVGPDMESFDGRPSSFGYRSSGRILGFSHLHLTGTSGKYGNILVAPVSGPVDPIDIRSGRSQEEAQIGYYGAQLSRYDIHAELTATRRVALHRYRFDRAGENHLTINLDHILNKGSGDESQRFLGGELHFISDHEIEGVGRYEGGWNNGGEYRVYFYAITDLAASGQRIWTSRNFSQDRDAIIASDQPFGASFDFDLPAGQSVQMKLGISFISSAQAKQNVADEMPGWDFNAVRDANAALWQQALSRITLDGASETKRRQFYTALYHSMFMPSDRTGENPLWHSDEPYYDDYVTLWDSFRTLGPLLTLIAPDRQRDMIRSLIDIYRHEGYLPDARAGNVTGRTQGGSNAEQVIADAYLKGLTGIDYKTAFAGMIKDAETPPDDPRKEGRGGLEEYKRLGYIPSTIERAGSRTIDYSYNDFAIAEMACALNHPAEAKKYAARARNWENLWDPSLTVEGVKGFIRPRLADGSWGEPFMVKRGTWPDFFYEADLWTYSLTVPHDGRRLVTLAGGDLAMLRRMEIFFERLHFDMTNEQGFLLPYLYHWAGRPDRSADRIVEYLEKWFEDSRGGLPGNDDSGAMSSWFIFNSLGIYPNAGQDVYLIGTPSFPMADIDLGGGKHFRIVADNLDQDHLNRYVQSATLNGAPLDTAWFRHGQIKNGGELVLHMGSEPTAWGTKIPPPSLSDPQSPLCAAAQ